MVEQSVMIFPTLGKNFVAIYVYSPTTSRGQPGGRPLGEADDKCINSLPIVVGQNNSILPIVVEPIVAKNIIDLPIVVESMVEPIEAKTIDLPIVV